MRELRHLIYQQLDRLSLQISGLLFGEVHDLDYYGDLHSVAEERVEILLKLLDSGTQSFQ